MPVSILLAVLQAVLLTRRMEVMYEAGRIDNDREQAAQRRHANLDVKMHKTPSDASHRAGTTVSITELQAVRTAQGIGSPSQQAVAYPSVQFQCRKSDNSKQIDQMLGTGVISFPETETMLGTTRPRNLETLALLTTTNSAAI